MNEKITSKEEKPEGPLTMDEIMSMGRRLFDREVEIELAEAVKHAIQVLQDSLENDNSGNTLKTIGGMPPEFFYLFFALLQEHTWFLNNTIIVCFNVAEGGSYMAFGLKKQILFWKIYGRDFLRSPSVRVYSLENYAKEVLGPIN